MPIVGFAKQGTAKLKTPYGPKLVGIINIRTSEREAAPQDNFFWYELCYEKSLLKSLKKLHPVKLAQPAPEQTSDIPAQVGTRPDNADPGVCIGGPLPPQGDETPLKDVIPPKGTIAAEAGHGPLGENQEETQEEVQPCK